MWGIGSSLKLSPQLAKVLPENLVDEEMDETNQIVVVLAIEVLLLMDNAVA